MAANGRTIRDDLPLSSCPCLVDNRLPLSFSKSVWQTDEFMTPSRPVLGPTQNSFRTAIRHATAIRKQQQQYFVPLIHEKKA